MTFQTHTHHAYINLSRYINTTQHIFKCPQTNFLPAQATYTINIAVKALSKQKIYWNGNPKSFIQFFKKFMLLKDIYHINDANACTALTMNSFNYRVRAFILSNQMHKQGLQTLFAFVCHEYGAKANTAEKKRKLYSLRKQYDETFRQFLHRLIQVKLELRDEVKFAQSVVILDHSARETLSNTILLSILMQALPYKQQPRAAHKTFKTLTALEYFVGTLVDHEDIMSSIQENKFLSKLFQTRSRDRGRDRGRGQRFFSRGRNQNFFKKGRGQQY